MKTLVSIIALGTSLAFSQLAQAGENYREPRIDINILIPSAYTAFGFDHYDDRRPARRTYKNDDDRDDDDDDDDWDDRDDDDDDD